VLERARVPVAALAIGLGYLGMAIVSLFPLGWTADTLPANTDALYCSWEVAWVARALMHAPTQVFAASILYPVAAPVAYSEPMLAVGALAAPVWALTGSAVTTYNSTLALTLALSAFNMFLLGREVSGSAPAGLVAGSAFAFATANLDSVARIQIVSSQWTPLALYFLVRVLRTRRWRDGLGCGLAFALQGLSCSYYELFFAVLLIATLPVLLVISDRPRLTRFPWGPLIGGATLAAALLIPVNLVQYRQLSRVESSRPEAQAATLENYLATEPGNWLYGDLLGGPELGYDARHFPGVIPVGLALLGIVALARHRPPVPEPWRYALPIAWLGAVAAALGLGHRIETPWGDVTGPIAILEAWIPGFAETRVPARFAMFVRASGSVLAAVGVAALSRGLRLRPRVAAASALLLALLVAAEHLSVPLPTWPVPTGKALPPAYAWLAGPASPDGPIVEFPPFPVRRRREEALWLQLSTFHWKPLANGYASFYPAHYDLVVNTLLDGPSPLAFEVLRVLGVRLLVFHPRPRADAEGRQAARHFEAALPRLLDGTLEEIASFADSPDKSYDRLGILGGERVFRILPRQSPRPQRERLMPESRYPRTGWRCEASADGCELALDGQSETLFATRTPQVAGDYFRVLFPHPLSVSGVSLASGRWSQFYPIEAEFFGLFGDEWVRLPHRENRLEFLQDLLRDPGRAALELHLRHRMTMSGIELRLGHPGTAFNPWLVPEVYAHH